MKDFEGFILDLKNLISINTVEGTPTKDAPFGENNKVALNLTLSLAKEMGFKTINYNNYAGEIVFGEGEEFGIIGHLDVVPAGDGWNTDPFNLTITEDRVIGRGVIDDKTPLLLCLYAFKELKNSGFVPNKKFRLFLGSNEETGWKDVEYLQKATILPEYGFSPDGDFPLSYAEKGILIVEFKLPKLKNFYSICGGTVINAVCGKASVKTDIEIDQKLLDKHGLSKNGNVIESIGKTCHGSHPELGINAIGKLFNLFLDCGENVESVVDNLFNDNGGLSGLSSEQGITTLSPNIVKEDDNYIYLKCDCRFPYPIEKEQITKILDTFNIEYTATIKHPTQYVNKDGDFVNALISAYNSVTGENGKPIAIGGSTFARVFKKGVSFGPSFKWSKSGAHDANESMSISELKTCYNIYKQAIININQIKN